MTRPRGIINALLPIAVLAASSEPRSASSEPRSNFEYTVEIPKIDAAKRVRQAARKERRRKRMKLRKRRGWR